MKGGKKSEMRCVRSAILRLQRREQPRLSWLDACSSRAVRAEDCYSATSVEEQGSLAGGGAHEVTQRLFYFISNMIEYCSPGYVKS